MAIVLNQLIKLKLKKCNYLIREHHVVISLVNEFCLIIKWKIILNKVNRNNFLNSS